MLMNAYAMESAQLRTEKIARSGKNADNVREMYSVFSREAMDVIDSAGRTVMAACSEGDTLRTNLAVLKRFTKYEPVNTIALRRSIAARLIAAERYVV
jgi:tRNA G10  N-methylase Trm11